MTDEAVLAAHRRVKDLHRHDRNDPEVLEAHRALNAALIAARVKEVVATAPPMSDEKLDRIAALLWAGSR